MVTSVMNFVDRGKWGKSSWRGNASGHVYRALFEQYKPTSFCDPCVGSGTSVEVAREMNIEAYGLDLHSGFNALRHSIRDTIGKELDLVVSHPPYGSLIRYSKDVWGNGIPHPDDLSECIDDEDFHEKLHLMLMNQREATKPNGIFGCLIGDLRKNGRYISYQAECISRMPANELASVIIKTQHNTVSGRNTYSNMKHAFIAHEYLLLWQKPKAPLSLLVDLSAMATQQAKRLKGVWSVIVAHAMMALGGKASLNDLYQKIAEAAPDKLQANENWKAKVRQTLQLYPKFNPVERGVWALA